MDYVSSAATVGVAALNQSIVPRLFPRLQMKNKQLVFALAAFIGMSSLSFTAPAQAQALPASAQKATTSQIQLGPITDVSPLASVICSFKLPEKKESDSYVFAEGDICPVGGGKCSYHALMNVDGKDVKLKKATPQKGDKEGVVARFKSGDLNVLMEYGSSACPEGAACESAEVKATLTVKKGHQQKKISLVGDCGA